jgi:MAP/microtubule affinity-regulating kinase
MTLNKFSKSNRLGRLQEELARNLFRQACEGVKYMHSLDICHRDLKVTNMLVDPKRLEVKIIDFGFAVPADRPLKMYCGTRSYMPPEILDKRTYIGKPCDVWSMGVVLYKLLVGDYPFGGKRLVDGS